MKKIELYLTDDFKDVFTEWDEVKAYKILSVADDVELWDRVISLDDKFYSVCCSQGNKYKIRELEQFDIEEEKNWDTSEIKCPICGYEEIDSWEYDSNYGEIKCGGCGSTLEWSREIEVLYSTEVKKSVQPIKF